MMMMTKLCVFGAFDASDICYTCYALPFLNPWPQVQPRLCHALDARAGQLSSIRIGVAERLTLGGREARSWLRVAIASFLKRTVPIWTWWTWPGGRPLC